MRCLTPLVLLALTGCISRPGVVDCTTGRAYPGYSKIACGDPCDNLRCLGMLGCCDGDACGFWHYGLLKCAFNPYGGTSPCGDDMVYRLGCTAPPLVWAPPAIPTPPDGHTVYLPPAVSPTPLPTKSLLSPPPAPTAPPSATAAAPLLELVPDDKEPAPEPLEEPSEFPARPE